MQATCVCVLCVIGVSLYALAALSFFCLTNWSESRVAAATTATGNDLSFGGTYSKCETTASVGCVAEEISRRARDLAARSRPDIW